MSGRTRTRYQCRDCGNVEPKWAGQCSACGAWNTLEEFIDTSGPAASRAAGQRATSWSGQAATVADLADVQTSPEARMATGLAELDRVLGGGLVAGSVVLLGGDPGIGKSTLLMQMLAAVNAAGVRTLYVTGEESAQQVRGRADRLGLPVQGLKLLTETRLDGVLGTASREKPQVMVIDSIQTIFTEALTSAPGSVAQVRECAAALVRFAKQSNTAVFLVGHVTKEGALAGPRVLEHMVDSVLYFEGDPGNRFRLVRAIKNRFGAVNELGVFAMTDRGLREVANPSAIFLSRNDREVPGSIVLVTREGTRPMLVEIQALVDDSQLASPRRVAVGVDNNRLAMLLAVLHRHTGIATHGQDVFVNAVGGVRVTETAADLALLLAIISSLRDRPLPNDLVVFGEVGLSGELRPVQNGPDRLREAGKHGFRRAIAPRANVGREQPEGMRVTAVTTLAEALEAIE